MEHSVARVNRGNEAIRRIAPFPRRKRDRGEQDRNRKPAAIALHQVGPDAFDAASQHRLGLILAPQDAQSGDHRHMPDHDGEKRFAEELVRVLDPLTAEEIT